MRFPKFCSDTISVTTHHISSFTNSPNLVKFGCPYDVASSKSFSTYSVISICLKKIKRKNWLMGSVFCTKNEKINFEENNFRKRLENKVIPKNVKIFQQKLSRYCIGIQIKQMYSGLLGKFINYKFNPNLTLKYNLNNQTDVIVCNWKTSFFK